MEASTSQPKTSPISDAFDIHERISKSLERRCKNAPDGTRLILFGYVRQFGAYFNREWSEIDPCELVMRNNK